MIDDNYDCIVLGGGPAGSTVATLVSEAGYRTLLVEREKMPRFHVGESLMPEAYWIFERLGVLEKMKHSSFTKKFSVQFVTNTGKTSAPFFFDEHDPRECSQSWQVNRAEFDQLLFDNAAEKGADCHDQTRVLEVLFDGEKATGVKLQLPDGTTRQVSSRVVADATGQQALIANRLGLRQDNPELQKVAIWSYFRNARRDQGKNEGATIILHTQDKDSWFWFIPLADNITSIGVVGDTNYLVKGRGKPEDIFAEELAKCPAMQERLAEAERTDKHRVAKEFSYTTSRRAGQGWVLVGDAYGFIDPIYSSGVYFALKTGELAADAINAGLQSGDLSGEHLAHWSSEFDQGSKLIRRLVRAYYTNDFSFGRFMRAHPEHQGNLTDLLIGRIFYDGAGNIFRDMQPWLENDGKPPKESTSMQESEKR